METWNPDEAAPLIGMAASTIRGWCKIYANVLSESANPVKGEERRLTQEDIAKLQRVKRWRDERRPPQEIARLLQAATTFEEVTHIVVDAPPKPQEGQGAIEAVRVPIVRLEARMDAVETLNDMVIEQQKAMREELTAVRQEAKERVNFGVTMILLGACGTLVIVALVLWLN